jgi:hypothetical protein
MGIFGWPTELNQFPNQLDDRFKIDRDAKLIRRYGDPVPAELACNESMTGHELRLNRAWLIIPRVIHRHTRGWWLRSIGCAFVHTRIISGSQGGKTKQPAAC